MSASTETTAESLAISLGIDLEDSFESGSKYAVGDAEIMKIYEAGRKAAFSQNPVERLDVELPKSVEHAELMHQVSEAYLKVNAPDRFDLPSYWLWAHVMADGSNEVINHGLSNTKIQETDDVLNGVLMNGHLVKCVVSELYRKPKLKNKAAPCAIQIGEAKPLERAKCEYIVPDKHYRPSNTRCSRFARWTIDGRHYCNCHKDIITEKRAASELMYEKPKQPASNNKKAAT